MAFKAIASTGRPIKFTQACSNVLQSSSLSFFKLGNDTTFLTSGSVGEAVDLVAAVNVEVEVVEASDGASFMSSSLSSVLSDLSAGLAVSMREIITGRLLPVSSLT